MAIQHEWEMEHVPHSIYIRPLNTYDVWPYDPNHPFTLPYIQEINTFDDWRIVPISRPVINPPVFKENYLDVPGTYGSLDCSRAHTGLPIYGNRTGSWEFVVLNDFRPWEMAYSDIQHTVHGKRCFVALEDDLDHFYVGTLKVNQWRSDPGWSRIVIDYNLEPFKYNKKDFQEDYGYEFDREITLGGGAQIVFHPTEIGWGPVNPWIKCAPNSSSDDANLLLIFTNPEIYAIDSIYLTTKNKYVQIPEFILSNESGNNECQLLLQDNRIETGTSGYHIDINFTRRYL